MPRYLIIQTAPVIDSISDDGHIGRQKPWPVIAEEETGLIATPSSALGMVAVVGFQRDLAVHHIDVQWSDVVDDPDRAVNTYLVYTTTDEGMHVSLSAVESASVLTTTDPLPVER